MTNNKKLKNLTSLSSVGAGWQEAWQLYVERFHQILEIYYHLLLAFVPWPLVLLLAYFLRQELLGLWWLFILFPLFLGALIWSIYIFIRIEISLILLFKQKKPLAKTSFLASQYYLINYLGVSFLVLILLFAWSLLLIIPAIIFGIYYIFAVYSLLFEDKRPFSAIEHSQDLVKGYWWPVFGRLFLLFLFAWGAYLLILSPTQLMAAGSIYLNLYFVLVNILWLLISPLVIAYFYNLYQELTKLKAKK